MKTLRNILMIAAFILTCVQLEAQEGRKSDTFTIKRSMYGFLPHKAGICGIELGQTTISTLETEHQQICSDEFDGLIGTRLLGYYRCYFDFDKLEFYINR